jgi:hypothetical protein
VSEFEFAARVVALLAAAFATYKGGFEVLMHGRARLRDEYRFAKEFFEDMNTARSPMHAFLRDKGLQAIAGTDSVTANEVEYLLKLPEPAVSLKDYVFARNLLTHRATAGEIEIFFKRSWEGARKRWIAKALGFSGYVVLFMAAMSPLFLPFLTKDTGGSLKLLLVTLPVFGGLAFFVLLETARVARAERLIGRQAPRRAFRSPA